MPKTVTVYAAQSFTHSGRVVSVGEPLTVSPIEAASLNYRKLATLTNRSMAKALRTAQITAEPEPQLEPEPEPEQPKRRRRTYKRRDLRAEDSDEQA